MICTHQFTNKGNGPPLAEVWHAVNAKRCVSPEHTHTHTDQNVNEESEVANTELSDYFSDTQLGNKNMCY